MENGKWKIVNFVDKIILYSFYIIFFLTPFVFSPSNSELFELPKMYLVYALTIIVLGSWATKSILAGKLIFRRTFFDIPLVAFLLSQFLSTITSIDIYTSIFGYYSRANGGLLSLVTYSLLYWAFVSNLDYNKARKIILLILFSATLISIYAILEHFGVSISCILLKGEFSTNCWVQKVQERVFATLGQPNWLASWLVAIIPISWALIKERESFLKLTFFYSSTLILFSALLFTKSRSGLLGFGVAFILFWTISFINLKFYIATGKFFLLLVSLLSIIAVFGSPWTPSLFGLFPSNNLAIQPSNNSLHEPAETKSGNQTLEATESFEIRTIVWRGAIDIWRKNPILGTGPETFAYSYWNFRPVAHNLTSEWELLYNKAHNEYLNYLANTGIVGLGMYMVLIGSFILLYFTSPYSLMPSALLAGYTSILVTNFFGFSVVTTNLLFFLYPAMAVTGITNKELRIKENQVVSFKKLFFVFITLILNSYFLIRLFQLWHADTLYTQAQDANESWQPVQAVKKLQEATSLSPFVPVYWHEFSKSASILAEAFSEDNKKKEAQEWASLSVELSDKAVWLSPRNVSFWTGRAKNFQRLSSIDKKYLELAKAALDKASTLSPTDPKIFYNLGVLYERLGDKKKALELVQKSLELKPDYNDAKEALEKLKTGGKS